MKPAKKIKIMTTITEKQFLIEIYIPEQDFASGETTENPEAEALELMQDYASDVEIEMRKYCDRYDMKNVKTYNAESRTITVTPKQ